MEKIDFFDSAFQTEAARSDSEFGIYDPGNNLPAITTKDTNLYQAVVKNPQCYTLQFVAVDHNMGIQRPNGDTESTCDGMMYDDHQYISFVELKDKDHGWASEAVEQLKTTIGIFAANHRIEDYQRHFAYAVNVQHPAFNRSFKQVMQRFKAETKFVLRFGTIINVNY